MWKEFDGNTASWSDLGPAVPPRAPGQHRGRRPRRPITDSEGTGRRRRPVGAQDRAPTDRVDRRDLTFTATSVHRKQQHRAASAGLNARAIRSGIRTPKAPAGPSTVASFSSETSSHSFFIFDDDFRPAEQLIEVEQKTPLMAVCGSGQDCRRQQPGAGSLFSLG